MATKKVDYKALSQELEDILLKLQSSDLDVDEALKAYERGMKVAKELEEYLAQAENTITRLKVNLGSAE